MLPRASNGQDGLHRISGANPVYQTLIRLNPIGIGHTKRASERASERDRHPRARVRERERERESESERASERERGSESERASDMALYETRRRRTVGTVTRESGGSRPSTGPLLCVSIVDFLVVVFFFVRVRRSKGDEGGGGSPRSSNHSHILLAGFRP